jgi:bifunctional oligoribonuclease and PAP phosphatase NrnA
MLISNRIPDLILQLKQAQGLALVISHNNPDGDAIGSAIALSKYFVACGIRSNAIVPNAFPSFLSWMDGAEDMLVYQRDSARVSQLLEEAQAIFCVDFNALNRIANLEEKVRNSKAVRVLIDHHPEPAPEFDLQYSEISASSTSELVLRLIQQDNGEHLIDKAIAEALYVGIMTDTGSFSFSCAQPFTFEAVALLIRKGLQPEPVHRRVYDTFTADRMRLLGYSISEKLIIWEDLQTAYISLSHAELKRFNYNVGDTEGIVNYALSISGIKVAALFTERKDHIRISFRSKGSFAVNQIARNHYEGGGHRNAAGGNSYSGMEETLTLFRQHIELYRDQILEANED